MVKLKEKRMPETILFIDKDEPSLNSLEGMFSDRCITSLNASNVKDALDYLKNEQIAVVFVDSGMPDTGEMDLISKVREISPYTLIILMTTNTDIAKAVEAMSRGDIFRYILKPLDYSELTYTLDNALKRFQIICSLKTGNEADMLSVVKIIESKASYFIGHSDSVARHAMMIANAMDIPEEIKRDLQYGCRLHDLGKIDVPGKILSKKQPLIKEEYETIKNHPGWGAAIVRQAGLSELILNIVLHHHERYDGTGYPSGIRGEDIPLVARITAVADVYSALTSDRPYRKKYENEKVVDIMLLMKENVFDPEILEIFLYKCLGLSRPCFETINK
jgi:putative nucleotidyltransferase with HDIG domain